MGFAFQQASQLGAPTVMTNLWNSGKLERNMASLLVDRSLGHIGDLVGALYLGGYDPSKLHEPIFQHPVRTGYIQPHGGFWGLKATGLQVNNGTGPIDLVSGSNYAMLSTSNPLILVSLKTFFALMQVIAPDRMDQIGWYDSGMRAWLQACDDMPVFPPVTLFIDGAPYVMTPEDLLLKSTAAEGLCFFAIGGFDQPAEQEPMWILGTSFFQHRYTLLDYENRVVTIGRSQSL